jgi:hypothetical protein
MSRRLESIVWDLDMPPARKLLLLSLVDQGNDAGQCYPTYATLEKRCGFSRRTLFTSLAELESEGWLTREVIGGTQRMRFTLNLGKLNQSSLFSGAAPAPVQNSHRCNIRTSADSAPVQNSTSTSADSALHKATIKSKPEREAGGSASARDAEHAALSTYDKQLIEPYLPQLPPSVNLQRFAAFVKHRNAMHRHLSIQAWLECVRDLRALEAEGQDLNEALRLAIRGSLIHPVDPRTASGPRPSARGSPGKRTAGAAAPLDDANYQSTGQDELPAFLQAGTG